MTEKHEEITELLALAQIALEVGDKTQAGRYLSQLLELDPTHQRAVEILRSLQPGEWTPPQTAPPAPEPAALPSEEVSRPPEEAGLGAQFLPKCPVCRDGRLHWPLITSTSGQTAQIRCTHCSSVLVPIGNQSSIGQFLFRYSDIDPRYTRDSVEIWARSLTRQELAEIARKGAPREPSQTSLYVALSLGDFSMLRPVDPQHAQVSLLADEEAHFLVEGIIYAQKATIESDNITEIMERVAQGISIMPLSFQTRPKLMELEIRDTGSLLITNQRYVFSGRKYQLAGDLRQVLSVEAYLDGVGIERSDRAPADFFLGMSAEQAALTSAVFRGALKNLLSYEE